MSDLGIKTHPQAYARLAGLIYLLVIVFGGFSEGVVNSRLVVSGDDAQTAGNILASLDLWRLSVAGNLAVAVLATVQLWIEYLLLSPVRRDLALLFLVLNIVSLAVESVSKLFLLLVAPILTREGLAAAFEPQQVHALAGLALSAHDVAFHITLLFFGAACLVSGALIFRSGYLPRTIGALMQVAGACYLIASTANLFLPDLARAISPWILLPVLVGEASLCLWLLIKGVDRAKWSARVGLAAATT